MYIRILVFASFLLFISSACSKKGIAYTTPEDYRGGVFKSSKEVYDNYQIICDSLDKRWDNMSKLDKKKFKLTHEILKKASKYGNFNDSLANKALLNLKAAEQYNFTEERIMDDRYIDEYDSITSATFRYTYQVIDQLEPTCEKCFDMYEEIEDMETLVIAHRIGYDQWSDVHNWYIKKYENKLEKEFVSPFDLKPRPIFRIEPNK